MPEESNKRQRDELLTIDEVAELLKVPVATLRKWRTSGNGPQGFRIGKYMRFRRSSVEDFIATLEAGANQ
ncbi:helix-turn-helix domain-containing protein [Actinoplanes sp. NPDC049118]|uniref:helix-turn-helix transcriptional regulator n=1 Tax=Actinoplanes sp. NPDC049118 TaxID=3155769 RepID=UPI0033CBD566